jgi:hypothetical protein
MLLTLLGLVPGLANTLAAWVSQRGNEELAKIGADKDVAVAQLNAISAANNAKASVIALPGVKWLMFALYAPAIAHFAGIILGRMNVINWDMLSLDSIEQSVLLSLVIYVPASKWVSR